MKTFIVFLFVLFFGCGSDSVTNFEPETFNLEVKEWGRKATFNNSTFLWNGLAGMQVGHSIRNNHEVALRIEYVLNIRGARLQEDIGRLISIADSPLLAFSVGLLSKGITANLDPINLIDGNIIEPDQHLFAVAFTEVDWDEWFSVYSTDIINATTVEGISKVFVFEVMELAPN